jgi:predicted enzyme related to lactoylglutathione lyase
MYTVTKFPHGTFSWADLMSTDQASAHKFYVDLMGWGTEDAPMGEGLVYTSFQQDGHNVGAVSPMPQQMLDQGVPSHWQNYITVDDVDALEAKVTELGGKVIAPPFDVFDNGRMMTIQDPTGGVVCLWQAKTSIGAGMVNTVGAMCWNELSTSDPAAAQDFYGKLLGWTFDKDPNSDYYYIKNNGRFNGGILKTPDEMKDAPSFWMVYYTVKDTDATAAKAKELGGTLVSDVIDSPAGRMVVISDPTGGVFSAIQAGNPEVWLEHGS